MLAVKIRQSIKKKENLNGHYWTKKIRNILGRICDSALSINCDVRLSAFTLGLEIYLAGKGASVCEVGG